MRSARLFRLVWRIDALLLLLAGLLATGALLAVLISSLDLGRGGRRGEPPPAPVAVTPERGEALTLGRAEELPGTPFVLLPLGGDGGGKYRGDFSSGGGPRQTRNLLFHDVDRGTSRWLLPDQSTLVVGWEPIRARAGDQPAGPGERDEATVRWIRYELQAPGRDGRPGPTRLAVSGPGGEGLTSVLEGVDEVLGWGPRRAGRQAVFFRRGGTHLVAELDYAAPRPAEARPLPAP